MVTFFYGAAFALLLTLPAIGICCWIISSQWKVMRELNNRIQAPSFKEFAATLPKEPAVKPAPERRFAANSWVGTGGAPESLKDPKKSKPADPVLGIKY